MVSLLDVKRYDEALRDSGLQVTEANAERVGVAIGSGIGGLGIIEKNYETILNSGPRKVSPFLIPAAIINMISGHVSKYRTGHSLCDCDP